MAKQGQTTNQGLEGLTAAVRDTTNSSANKKGPPYRLRICTTLLEPLGSQYAAHASINLRRFSSASLRR